MHALVQAGTSLRSLPALCSVHYTSRQMMHALVLYIIRAGSSLRSLPAFTLLCMCVLVCEKKTSVLRGA